MAGEPLPNDFYQEMTHYIGAYNKKFAQARKKAAGDVDEFSMDPPILHCQCSTTNSCLDAQWKPTMYLLGLGLCCNGTVWLRTRSTSIHCLAFYNFSVGVDSVVITKYDDSKGGRTGEKLLGKNVYSNPLDWTMCSWLATGIYCFLHQGNLVENEQLFLKKGTKDGAGSTKYHEQVVGGSC